MVLLAKGNRNTGGFDVISDITDTKDLNGFSDPISTVGAKSAKFSGGGVMKANSGLKIGILQLKINTGAITVLPTVTEITPPVTITYEVGTNSYNAQTIDQDTSVDINSSSFNNNQNFGIYDTQSSTNKSLTLTVTEPAGFQIFGIISQAFINGGNNRQNVDHRVNVVWNKTYDVDESDDPTFVTGVTNILTGVNGAGLLNFNTTKRYFRITHITNVTFTSSNIQTGFSNEKGPEGCFFGCTGMTKTPRNISDTTIDSIVIDPPATNNVTVRVRSSVGLDTADGSIIIADQLMIENSTLIFDTDLLLTGSGEFVTLQIVSQTGNEIPVTLSEITSIQEV